MFGYLKNFFHFKKYHTYNNFHFEELGYKKSGAESYKNNVIVNRCVNIISQSAAHVPWVVLEKKQAGFAKSQHHIANQLLRHPSPNKAGAEFFSELIANKLLFGNAYILAVKSGAKSLPQELYSLNPSAVEVVMHNSRITGYKYSASSEPKLYPIDPLTLQSNVLHIKSYNPGGFPYGVSCLEAAGRLIDLHNRATEWNHTLLKNGARPSGAFVVGNGNYLTQEQFMRLQQDLQDKYYGSNNAGRPLLLEGGLDWKEMSISPRDMDFIESKNSAAREIALAFGLPPQLLGINGDNTYSNMQEARLALWEETLIPLLDKLADSLSGWFSYLCAQELRIDFDKDGILALTDRREKLWMTLNNVNFMSINEKRSLVGLAPISQGDKIVDQKS